MSFESEILVKILNIPGVGSKTAQRIVTTFNGKKFNDDDAIDFVQDGLKEIRFSRPISEIAIRDAFHKGEVTIEQSSKAGIKAVSIFDQSYPVKLRQFKNNPPVLLYYKGDISTFNDSASCAVIGTREPSENGYRVGVRVGELLAENDVIVISGLAKGCDTAGHTGCLNRNGKTVAVLAHGLKHLYPKENRKLAEDILDKGGALITEYPYEQTARNNFFVERDRIQAGLSDNIFVVETGVKGGTMHTVKYAFENHRQIFTYCHAEKFRHEEKAQGNQHLIKQKIATPVANTEDFKSFITLLGNSVSKALDNIIIRHGSYIIQSKLNPETPTEPIKQSDFDYTGSVIDLTKAPAVSIATKPTEDSSKQIEVVSISTEVPNIVEEPRPELSPKKGKRIPKKHGSEKKKGMLVKKDAKVIKKLGDVVKKSKSSNKKGGDSQMNLF